MDVWDISEIKNKFISVYGVYRDGIVAASVRMTRPMRGKGEPAGGGGRSIQIAGRFLCLVIRRDG